MKGYAKEKAVRLRKGGWSYNVIAQRLGVSKSTLSHWLREIPYTPNQEVRKRIREGPAKSARLRHNQKVENISRIKSAANDEIGKLSKRDLWILGLGLYIGEGSKLYENIRIINSNPDVVRLAVKWFKNVCGLSTKNLTLAIHLYPDTPQTKALMFWSKTTGIPLSQFGKTQVDRRSNKSNKKQRKLPYGTAHLTIRSRGDRKNGVELHRRIIGWIERVYTETRV